MRKNNLILRCHSPACPGNPEKKNGREKRLKKYNRKWKLNLIEEVNPNWKDLYEELATGLPERVGQ